MLTNCDYKINQVFFISTKRELSVKRIELQAPTLAGPPQTTKGDGTPSCATPWQLTMYKIGGPTMVAYLKFLASFFKLSGKNSYWIAQPSHLFKSWDSPYSNITVSSSNRFFHLTYTSQNLVYPRLSLGESQPSFFFSINVGY